MQSSSSSSPAQFVSRIFQFSNFKLEGYVKNKSPREMCEKVVSKLCANFLKEFVANIVIKIVEHIFQHFPSVTLLFKV